MDNSDQEEDDVSQLWRYRSDPPQRYTAKYEIYRAWGGPARPAEFLERALAADPANGVDMARFYFFCLAFDLVVKEALDGDVAELGVYKGGTAALLATFARRLNRTAYLFDTFEGFHEADLSGIDAGTPTYFKDTSLEAVRAVVGDENVQFVKGRFPETTGAVPPDARFSIVHLDCDLYAPLRDALAFFYPRLTPGGFMIVHDYSSLAWGGPERAVDEFLANKTESVTPLPDSAGSIVFRKARRPGHDRHWLVRRGLALTRGHWAEAGYNALAPLLERGWSGPEHWGVWGVDADHVLRAPVPAPVTQDYEIEVDCNAALLGARIEQEVDVVIGGLLLATWRFTQAENRSVRSVRAPAGSAVAVEPGTARFLVEFHPRHTESPKRLDPTSGDIRRLGMALHRIRLTPTTKAP
jgi:Macrocin-O-methyltransferase (TylF)